MSKKQKLSKNKFNSNGLSKKKELISKKNEVQLKKEKIKTNSRLKKRLKFTAKKIKIDSEKLIKSIKSIVEESLEKKEISQVYVYILLKNSIIDGEENKEININKIIKLPNPIEIKNQKMKIGLTSDLLCETKEKLNENLNLDSESSEITEIITNEELIKIIKEKSSNEINSKYKLLIINNKLGSKIKQILKSKELLDKIETIFFEQKKGKKIFEYLKLIIKESIKGTILKSMSRNKKIYKIKIGNTKMGIKSIYKNIKILTIKIISYLMSISQKYNSVNSVVIKSESSLPY